MLRRRVLTPVAGALLLRRIYLIVNQKRCTVHSIVESMLEGDQPAALILYIYAWKWI
jgi:hypothetical protein